MDIISSERLSPPAGHYSQGIAACGLVFVSGQLPFAKDTSVLPDGIAAQTEQTLRNLTEVLAALGLGLGNVVSVRGFLTRFKRDYDEMNTAYAGFFTGTARPVRTCVGVTDLVRDALIEIDCIARR